MNALNTFVLCAGEGSRWGNHRGSCKHLVRVEGERVLDRTVHQFKESAYAYGGTFRVVSRAGTTGHSNVDAAQLVIQVPTTYDSKYDSTSSWWNDQRTLLLLGDVRFTHGAVGLILDTEQGSPAPITFYGRFNGSNLHGTPYGELFAVSFDADQQSTWKYACLQVNQYRSGRTMGGFGWRVYRWVNGARGRQLDVPKKYRDSEDVQFVEIDDWTDDFDFPEDVERWERKRAEAWEQVGR